MVSPLRGTYLMRVFQSTVHFQLLTLPNSAIALSLLDPQHLHSMAVFSDTAKRLWGLCLFTRCSRPRVLTLRAGWNRLFIKFHLPLLLFRASLYYDCSRRLPFVLKTLSGRLRGTYHLSRAYGCGTPDALRNTAQVSLLTNDWALVPLVEWVGVEPTLSRHTVALPIAYHPINCERLYSVAHSTSDPPWSYTGKVPQYAIGSR